MTCRLHNYYYMIRRIRGGVQTPPPPGSGFFLACFSERSVGRSVGHLGGYSYSVAGKLEHIFFSEEENKVPVGSPPPPRPLSDYFRAGAASLPASTCKIPPLKKKKIVRTPLKMMIISVIISIINTNHSYVEFHLFYYRFDIFAY